MLQGKRLWKHHKQGSRWREPRCLITPHLANTPEMAVPLLTERVRDNVARRLAGQAMLGVVDVEHGY